MGDIKDEKKEEDLAAQEIAEEEKEENKEQEAEQENFSDPDSQEPAEETEDAKAQEEQADKMGLFGKKKNDKKDEQIAELKDRVQRQMAEFDNYRKRTDREKAAMYEVGAKSVIEKILPIADNFERGLETIPEDSEDPFVVGMQKVYKQLLSTLEELEVKPIPAVGEEFNPDYHNAVLHVEDDSVGENIIVEELQKGYTYRDNVVRHSMVKVAN